MGGGEGETSHEPGRKAGGEKAPAWIWGPKGKGARVATQKTEQWISTLSCVLCPIM